ncbi:MAG: MBL fold metallo-hydrolase [Chloroflexi bacterium]|nr:MBL fold metallo-hydrolase [Chloroflexota bacterium]
MSIAFNIVSIGCLSKNRFWNEAEVVRPAHATTTLIRNGDTTILVDPSLPGKLLERILHERTGLKPDQIDLVFLTCFRPVHRRGLGSFRNADVLMGENEIDSVRARLDELEEPGAANVEDHALIESEQRILRRIKPAPDRISPQIHLFPTPGATAGSCSLLLTPPARTVAIAGDAVLTEDFFDSGRIFEHSFDTEAAKEALTELVEIADVIIPGHDNIFMPIR